ncbi:MAG: sulfotransferase [Pseudomonadota bacterium]
MTENAAADPARPSPVFLVGAPRSGTTMLAAMIGSHSQYAVGPESQFFSKLSPQVLKVAVADPSWPDAAVGALRSLTLADQSVAKLFGIDEDALRAFLAAREPSARAMLEALTMPFADARGKPGWAEKTPNHLLNLDAIRAEWPEAAVVRIIRDPRDAALSTGRLPTFSSSFVANTLMWRSWQDRAAPFFDTDPRAITIRYEDLVANPEAQLRSLCEFLNVDYEPSMIEFANAAADVSSENETWKKPVSGALDRSRMYAWRGTLDEGQKRFASLINHEYLARFGYEHEAAPVETKRVFRMSAELAEAHEAALVAMAVRGRRWLPESDWHKADLVCERPPYRRSHGLSFLAQLVWGRLALTRLPKG